MDRSGLKEDQEFVSKVILIGDSGVGKSSILLRYTQEVFYMSHVKTVGLDFSIKKLKVNGKKIKMQLWDTAGDEKFRSIVTQFYKGAVGAFLVFDLTNEQTLENMKYWIRQLRVHASDDICKVLVGNKSDLPIKVKQDKIDEIVKEFGLKYFQTSACLDVNIKDSFQYMAAMIVDKFYSEISDVDGSSASKQMGMTKPINLDSGDNRNPYGKNTDISNNCRC